MSSATFVLIVEDDPFYSNIYKTKLEKEGIVAVLAHDGNQALKAAEERKPALVVLDLIIPGKDGFQTLAELKKNAALRDVPVLVLSNLSQDEDMKRCLELGAKEFLIKSNLPLNDLVAKIKGYLTS